MPICPYAQIRLNPPLMPLEYAICPYGPGHMPYAHLPICPDSSKFPFNALRPYYIFENMPYARMGQAICCMPI